LQRIIFGLRHSATPFFVVPQFVPCQVRGCVNGLNTSVWSFESGDGSQYGSGAVGWGNAEAQCYTNRSTNLDVIFDTSRSVLRIKGALEEGLICNNSGVAPSTRYWSSARIHTRNKLAFMYQPGKTLRVVARMRIPQRESLALGCCGYSTAAMCMRLGWQLGGPHGPVPAARGRPRAAPCRAAAFQVVHRWARVQLSYDCMQGHPHVEFVFVLLCSVGRVAVLLDDAGHAANGLPGLRRLRQRLVHQWRGEYARAVCHVSRVEPRIHTPSLRRLLSVGAAVVDNQLPSSDRAEHGWRPCRAPSPAPTQIVCISTSPIHTQIDIMESFSKTGGMGSAVHFGGRVGRDWENCAVRPDR
jgi:hypothetical protein